MEGADGVHCQERTPGREVVPSNKPTLPPKPSSKTPSYSEKEKVTDRLPALPPKPLALGGMLDSGNERTLSCNRSVPVKPVPHPPQSNGRPAEVPGKSLGVDESVVLGKQPEYEYVSLSPRKAREPSKKTKIHFKEIGKKMTLKEFCGKGKKLPCLVKVTAGYTSFCDRYSFGTDELLVVIEMKEIDTVRIRDNRGSTKKERMYYDVPLNSSLFSVVPSLDPEWKSVKGVILTPQYLLGSHVESLPNVLYSTSEWTTVQGRALPSGSFLFPQAVKKKKQEHILVAKIEDGSTVEITSECSGSFTTIRSVTDNLSLSTAAKCIKLPFECTLKPLEDDLFCDRVTIESVHKELFLFGVMKVSDGSIQDDVNSFQQLLEVPVNLNILVVTMIPRDENLLENIYESAQSYYNVTLRAKSKRIRDDPSIQGGVKGGHSPPRSRVTAKDPKPQHGLSHKDTLNSTSPKIPMRGKVKEGHSLFSSHASTKGPQPLHGPTQKQTLNSNSCNLKRGAHGRPLPDIPIPTATVASVIPISDSRTYEPIGEILPPTTPPIPSPQNDSDDTMALYSTLPNSPDTDTNICNLKLLDPMGVSDVLDAMNLSVYKENFQKELIDGELLSEFTEDMFIELGVERKIHRLKLMHVVKGRKDVSSVLNKK